MSTIQYHCPNCGGEIEYKPGSKAFACPYCGDKFNEEQIKDIFKINESSNANTNSSEDFSTYSCPSCGAEVIAETTTAATFCYYCHNPIILTGRLSGEYKPDKIIPFAFDREMATGALDNFCKKRWFLPKDFKDGLDKIDGVYVPFWLADCDVDGDMNAIGKNIRHWREGNYEVTETKEYEVYRAAELEFKDIPFDGISKVEDKLMEAIEPFAYGDFQDFSMSYLSGFIAEKYDVDKAATLPRVQERVAEATYSYLRADITGYDSVNVIHKNCNIKRNSFEYALLPVWFFNYKYREKDYQLAINGQTGKYAGALPLAKGKLAFVSFLFSLLAFGIVFAAFFLSENLDMGKSSIAGGITALVTFLLYFFITISRYKFTTPLSATNYIGNNRFTRKNDRYLRTHKSRRRIKDNK